MNDIPRYTFSFRNYEHGVIYFVRDNHAPPGISPIRCEDEATAALVIAGLNLIEQSRAGVEFVLTPIVSRSTGEPRVSIVFNGQAGQVKPDQARAIAMHLMRVAEQAETEAGLAAWLQEIGGDSQTGASAVHGFRAWRDDHGRRETAESDEESEEVE